MTCAELRARMVDPASSGQGRHAPVVDHMQICEECRKLARAFGSIERIYRPDPGLELPPDTEKRVFDRILAAPGAREAPPISKKLPGWAAWVMGLAALAVLVVFGLLALRRPSPASAPAENSATKRPASPSTSTEAGSAEHALSSRSAESPSQVPLTSAPVTEEERQLAMSLLDSKFLLGAEVLAGLDPFFPQDLSMGPVPDLPVPETFPGEGADITEKVLNWRHTSRAERDRILAAQKSFEARSPAEKQALKQRWIAWMEVGGSDTPGLYRLASRMQELDPKKLEKTKADLRAIARLPATRRISTWRSSPLGRSVTGQEAAAAEKLWAAQR